jgi:DNA-binding NarL/FixJ family response regulator
LKCPSEKSTSRIALDEEPAVAKVLVVDDSLFARIAVCRLLQKASGIAVFQARDGAQALEVIQREAPSVVVTDMCMPNKDGLSLVSELREKHPGIPAIVMTAYGSESAAMEALRAGAANYIPKCALATDLVETVRSVLSVCASNERKQRARACLQIRESQFEMKSDPSQIPALIELLLDDLVATGGCDSVCRIRVGVALNEALVNAVFHGNLEISSDLRQEDERNFYALAERRRFLPPYSERHVAVHVLVDRSEALFEIADEGPGFDTSSLYRPIEEDDLLRVGGRGMLLIRSFMDEVHHNGSGNLISMKKQF